MDKKLWGHIPLALLFLGPALLTLTTPIYSAQWHKAMNSTTLKINSVFNSKKTICFGRFLIDVPKTAKVVWGPAESPWDIVSYPSEGESIPRLIKQKIDNITSLKHNTEPSMLMDVFDSVNSSSKVVVGYENSTDGLFAQVYSFVRYEQTGFVQSIPSLALGVEDKSSPWMVRVDKNIYKSKVNFLIDIASRLRVRSDEEIPADNGFCFNSGFIKKNDTFEHERISIGFRFPEFPGIIFSLASTSIRTPNKANSLEAVIKEGKKDAETNGLGELFNKINILRKGERVIGPWKGDEALMRIPSKDGGPLVHEFHFISIGVANDMIHTHVDIELDIGAKGNDPQSVKPTMTDEDALKFWDILVSSIRVRPTVTP